jgi:Domain of unknown function (DUF4406)
MKKVYISLPITDKDETKQRELAEKVSSHLKGKGFDTVNPFDISDKVISVFGDFGKTPRYKDFIVADLKALETCDYIYQCKGWFNSHGCQIEYHFAMHHGIKIYT